MRFKTFAMTTPKTIFAEKTIDTRWNSWNKSGLIQKGYTYTGLGNQVKIHINDLSHGSKCRICVICPLCNKTRKATFKSITRANHSYCARCVHVHDLSQIKFGRLTAVELIKIERGISFWKCTCDCGKTKIANAAAMKNGGVRSCGCLYDDRPIPCSPPIMRGRGNPWFVDLTGREFGELTVIEYIGSLRSKSLWLCKCSCGNTTKVNSNSLQTGNTKSCGCLFKSQRGESHPNWNAGLTNDERKDRRITDEYKEWRSSVFERDGYICQNCQNKKDNKLVAHHLNNYSNYKKVRFNINNGITLCKTCHYDFHINYMRGWVKSCSSDDYHNWQQDKTL